MRKFKHKTTGVVVKQKFYKATKVYPTHYEYEYKRIETAAIHTSIDAMFVENSNDWEEVKEEGINVKKIMVELDKKHVSYLMKEEPNYLITAFRFKDSLDIWNLKKDGSYGANPVISKYTLNEMLYCRISVSDNAIEIYSVKNSKGEEFTIGDKVEAKTTKCVITKFSIVDNKMYVNVEAHHGLGLFYLEDIQKTKTPIFVSADNVEFYFDNSPSILYSVYPKESWTEKQCNVKQAMEFKNWLHFNKQEARQEYIDNNKPKYSLSDVQLAICIATRLKIDIIGQDVTDELKKLCK